MSFSQYPQNPVIGQEYNVGTMIVTWDGTKFVSVVEQAPSLDQINTALAELDDGLTKLNSQELLAQINRKSTLDLRFNENKHRVYEPFGLTDKLLTDAITTTRASIATYNSPFGVATAAVNTPRITYDPSTGKALGLLCEEKRTNLQLNSEIFTGAGWSNVNATVSDSGLSSVISGQNYKKLSPVAIGSAFLRSSGIMPTASTTYQISIYLKYNGSIEVVELSRDNSASWGGAVAVGTLNLRTGATTGSVTAVRQVDGGYRATLSVTSGSSVSAGARWAVRYESTNLTDSILIDASQLEVGLFPTSHVKTEASAVTRVVDNNSVPMANRLNLTEGTLFFEYECTAVGAGDYLFSLTGSDGLFAIRHRTTGGGNLNLIVSGGGFSGFNTNTSANLPIIGKNKLAVTYKAGADYKVCVNGVIGSFESTRSPALPVGILSGAILTLIRPTSLAAGRFTFKLVGYAPRALSERRTNRTDNTIRILKC